MYYIFKEGKVKVFLKWLGEVHTFELLKYVLVRKEHLEMYFT